jgi:hypothetical protein
VVDLYGMAGFDVLCVTDHVLRGDYRWPLRHERPCVDTTNVGAYLAEIERERASARSAYGLLLVPGFELTYNHPNPERAGHAVAVGCTASSRWTTGRPRRWSRRAPRAPRFSPPAVPFPTCYFARRWRELRGLFDRVELFNGRRLFSWVAEAGLPARRPRRPAPGRTASRLDDARPLRTGRAGARRLPALGPAGVPDAPRAAHRRARRVAPAAVTWYSVAPTADCTRSANEPLSRRLQPGSSTRPIRSREQL